MSKPKKVVMAASTSNSSRSFKLRGKVYRLSKADIERAAAKVEPRATDKYAVVISGRAYPPKQLIEAALHLAPVTFTTLDAQRILARLGFQVVSSERQLLVDPAAGTGAFLTGALERVAVETRAKKLFEAYLYSSGLGTSVVQREPHSGGTIPDFVLTVAGKRVALEVKELVAADFDLASEVELYDPCRPIRQKIMEAGHELGRLTDASRCLVLHSRCTPWPIFEWRLIYGAMRGGGEIPERITKGRKHEDVADEGVSRALDAVVVLDQLRTGFLRFRAHVAAQESRIGRPLSYTEYMAELYKARGTERDIFLSRLRVIVHESLHAQNPLPKDIFRGPYDAWYGVQDDGQIGRTFVGEEIKMLENENRGSPGS
jgi:hypothetical protein